MAFTTGTATSYNDLLDKLRLYCIAEGWTVLNWAPPSGIGASDGLLQMQGPGAGVDRRVFVNIRTYADTVNNHYSWRLKVATGYTPGAAEGTNPGENQTPIYFNLWQNPIDYFFFVNDRRVIVVAKISTAYVSMYAGFFLPFAVPQQYPFPLYVAGDFVTPRLWSYANSGRRMLADPGGVSAAESAAWVRTPGGIWRAVINQDTNAGYNDIGYRGVANTGFVWPYSAGDTDLQTNYYGLGPGWGGGTAGGFFDNLIPTRQGERALWPLTLGMRQEPMLGALDGCYAISGFGLATEQIQTIGSRDFQVFQNIQRATGNDFFAIEQVA